MIIHNTSLQNNMTDIQVILSAVKHDGNLINKHLCEIYGDMVVDNCNHDFSHNGSICCRKCGKEKSNFL